MGLAQPSDSTTFGRTDPLPESVSAYSNNACCVLYVVCCMLYVARCALYVACCMLYVACCALQDVFRPHRAPARVSQRVQQRMRQRYDRCLGHACHSTQAHCLPLAHAEWLRGRHATAVSLRREGRVSPAPMWPLRIRPLRAYVPRVGRELEGGCCQPTVVLTATIHGCLLPPLPSVAASAAAPRRTEAEDPVYPFHAAAVRQHHARESAAARKPNPPERPSPRHHGRQSTLTPPPPPPPPRNDVLTRVCDACAHDARTTR